MSSLCKASCLVSDVRAQQRTWGNTDGWTAVAKINLKVVRFPDSTWLCTRFNFPTDLTETWGQFKIYHTVNQCMCISMFIFKDHSLRYIYKCLCFFLNVHWVGVGLVSWKDVASPVRRGWVCSWRMLDRKCQKHIWNSYIQEVNAWQRRPSERCSACLLSNPLFSVWLSLHNMKKSSASCRAVLQFRHEDCFFFWCVVKIFWLHSLFNNNIDILVGSALKLLESMERNQSSTEEKENMEPRFSFLLLPTDGAVM